MSQSPEDVAASNQSMRPLHVLPGGTSAVPEEYVTAAILLGAFGALWMIRKHLGTEGRTMASGTAAVVFLLYYLAVTAIVRLTAAELAQRGDTSLARGFAFYA